ASQELVAGLTDAMGLPDVRVEVLAARPHSRWGELHGLYTHERGRKPKIQLWMRTAKMKRVVAFRSYLRTLLHEVGHHVDYTGLRLPETKGRVTMPTMEEYAKLSADDRMRRMARTADELAAAIRGRDDTVLSRRPDGKNWAAKEAICHLRDVEEMFTGRFGMILAMDNPKLAFDPTMPDRWAEERQYLRNDAQLALAAFRARRVEALALLRTLTPEQWKRAGIHATRGPITINDFVTLMSWHDDNHLDQLKR